MASVSIVSSVLSPSTKTIRCQSVTVGFKRDLIAEPYANGGSMAVVQTQSQENLRYTLQSVHLAGSGESSTILSYTDLLTLAKLNYTGSNAPTLSVVYGKSGSTLSLVGYDGVDTTIPVIVESFNFNIDASDSRDAYRPTVTINFLETG